MQQYGIFVSLATLWNVHTACISLFAFEKKYFYLLSQNGSTARHTVILLYDTRNAQSKS